ncbi:hypothetical protein DBB29_19515 [Pandoraea cepalis]|uniref:Uncharacterized protein n=1 Tax=Pandoraea cepalis TaxID=2508294 RepID=A0AAW7MPL0_9BURK|nr:hypothetical protein [Pandoraea cepalis]MDN4574794.1 hypothetical protein [Pandoraea cepalis]MDN4580297.1 hypothetical protein [Pandoraea cepalis]
MLVDFHAASVNLDAICADLANGGVVMVETYRVNFKRVESDVRQLMPDCIVLGLAVEGADRDWYRYLINTEVEDFESSSTSERVARAVEKWQAAGLPLPYSIRV